MDYIAVLDFEHLDNGLFLTAFAKAVASHKGARGIVLHGESEYTERLIQTGMMREEARIRAIKDLNHRLVALFADQGVAAIGLNSFQRGLISEYESGLAVDIHQIQSLPEVPLLLLSNLIQTGESGKPAPYPLAPLAFLLRKSLEIDEIFIFSLDDRDEIIKCTESDGISVSDLDPGYVERVIPTEFRNSDQTVRITTASAFASYPDL